MSDLVTWLRAQLDEDERIVRALHAKTCGHGVVTVDAACDCDWHVARVLAEVDAKRRILDWHDAALANRTAHPDDVADAGWVLAMVKVAKLMAVPYADREGFDREWLP